MEKKEKTSAEWQREYRAHLYAAGLKTKLIWVPRDSAAGVHDMDRRIFVVTVDTLTARLDKAAKKKLYRDTVNFMKEAIARKRKK